MLIKYSEIYLGVKHRQPNKNGGFDGGPMYYLRDAFKNNYVPCIAAFLICLYGVETYQFLVLVDRIEHSFELNRMAVILGLLALVLYSSIGGIKRLASICNIHILPEFFATVITSAFTGHAPIGGFVGSSMILATYHGMSKTVYSGDIGIGYDSIVQSETNIVNPEKQATLAVYALFTDTFICILTNTMLGVTGAWYKFNHLDETTIVSKTIANYFPYSDLFVTLLLFFAGFTTIIAYLTTGTKCAKYLSPKYGKIIYLIYAIFAFIFFCNFSQDKVIVVMGLLSGILVLINVSGMIKLRKEIKFN
jgi:AGCS family alanine or glycine:cation symporter